MEARCEGAFLELAHAGEAREQGEVKRASYNQPNNYRALTGAAYKSSIVIEQATSSYSFRFPELSQSI
jgi:hypothetical protein